MGYASRVYKNRAVRYTLRPQDDNIMRYAFNRNSKQTFATEFINVSETGMAFAVEPGAAPRIGEVIKVEFPIPGESRMAWFARVVRVEMNEIESRWYDETTDEASSILPPGVIVAVRFMNLPEAHQIAIRNGLKAKIRQLKAQKKLKQLQGSLTLPASENSKLVLYLFLICLLIFGLFMISRYFERSENSRPVIWGERIGP